MTLTPDQVFRGRRVVVDGEVRPAAVAVRNGVIAAVGAYDDVPGGVPTIDAGDALLMAGVVDTHVHVNEPGRTEWEGFETATRAAAAGGVTTLVDMPLNSVPATTSVRGLRAKRAAAAGRCRVDVGFWGGVVPGNAAELAPLWEAGVLGFKCFLSPSGVDEFGHAGEADLRRAMPILAKLGAPLLVHAEHPETLERAAAAAAGLDPRDHASWLRSRPVEAEVEAVALLLRLCREFGTRVHIVHLAAPEALPLLREARAEGLPVTVETCPHYLHFAAEEIPAGATAFKCAPPIRGRDTRERLWEALSAGDIDLIASDHSPCPPGLKGADRGDFFRAWGGIASLQLALPVVWTAARARGHGPERLAEWMCAAPARLAGLGECKGAIAPGRDADFVIWDPDAELRVDPDTLHHRHRVTPYAGATLAGVVHATYVRGARAYARDGHDSAPAGRILSRGNGMTDFEDRVDLASERLGGAVIFANDEFFAARENLLKPTPPEWREHEYTERGKWMDGWETRRRRTPGHDWCLVRLGAPGVVRGVVVDTGFFRGNYPEHCAIEACELPGTPSPEELTAEGVEWFELLPQSPLQGDARNRFAVHVPRRATHLRLHIFPDGGVARLRVHGDVVPTWTRAQRGGGEVDLAALENGGWVTSCSDMFYGHRQNLILPGRSLFMGDGWETRRRRGPGHDWSVVRLAAESAIHRVEIDTDHFKGNAPDRCSLEGIHLPDASPEALADPSAPWVPLLPETSIQPHSRYRFERLASAEVFTHVRLNIFPDGGIARLRLFGTLPPEAR